MGPAISSRQPGGRKDFIKGKLQASNHKRPVGSGYSEFRSPTVHVLEFQDLSQFNGMKSTPVGVVSSVKSSVLLDKVDALLEKNSIEPIHLKTAEMGDFT